MNRILLVIVLAMLVNACAAYTLVEPRRTPIGETYSVEPQIAWSQRKAGNAVFWTVDGQGLEELWFVNAVNDDEPLVKGQPDTKNPIFKRGMTAIEIQELVSDTLGAGGGQKIESEYLKPFSFGGHQGFRFELTFLANNGLEKQVLVVGSVIEDKLYLIVYSGTRAHYFPKYRGEVEKLISSIKMQ